ncbi:MAG: outer membrane protein assembly factor BamD [Phycisphaerales bacterium]|nr:outer membrane protein assembly factor BamD [Planctomycetota bacterium]MCH8509457.1 outer membrane protein assembly factor BamD [Phycisphaerales bacterium]
MPRPILTPILALLLLAGPLFAQATEFTLEDDGVWAQTDAPEPGTDEHVMWQARRHLAEGRPGQAVTVLSGWLDEHGRTRNPYLAEAYFLRGEARLANDREYQALFDFETVIRDFSATPYYARAVQREYEIGMAYLGGLRRRFLGMRIENARPLGEELLIRVQERLPGSALAEQAALDLAQHYYDRRELKLAAEMYSIFRSNYPDSEHLRFAMLREIECNIARFKGPRYDGSGLIDAKILIERYRQRYPGESARTGIMDGLETWVDESAAQHALENARWYLRTKDEPSARFLLVRLINRHPGSDAAAEAVGIMEQRGWLAVAPTPVARPQDAEELENPVPRDAPREDVP